MELFWERGYEGASIGDLTEVMGISAPSLYAAFGGKEQLFREAVALYDTLEGSVTERALREEPTAQAAIAAMLRENAEVYADPAKPSGCLIVLGATTWTPRNEAVRAYLTQLRRQTHDAIRARLERGVLEGDVPPGADLDALAAYFNTVLEGLSIQARDGASAQTMLAVAEHAMAAWDRLSS
jgi:AcrR family transcriptional regulator